MTINLSVVVPCYNEEKRLDEGVNHYLKFLKKQKYSWELILVNDGSNDGTLKQISKYSKKYTEIKLIAYTLNRGKGYAVAQGVFSAKGENILFTDLDHSVDINNVNRFMNLLKGKPGAVIASRRMKGSKLKRRQTKIREILGRGFTMLVRISVDWQIKDATCGFKIFKKNVAKKIFSNVSIYNWAFDAEILYLCKKYKIQYIQAPVLWSDQAGSKVSLGKDIMSSLLGLVLIRLNDFQKKY